MPDTLTPERRYQIEMGHDPRHDNDCEVCALLAHIDALTAAARASLDAWGKEGMAEAADALAAVIEKPHDA